MQTSRPQAGIARRDWLRTAAGATVAAGLALSPRELAAVRAEWGMPSDLSPEQALAALEAGNARFVAGKTQADRSKTRIAEVEPKQAPFAAFLGCADSRVPIEIVFDQGFGDIFVTRIAGNIATPETIGSLEFGTLVLGAKLIYVLGHSRCGAVDNTIKLTDAPGQISSLYAHIRPAAKAAKGDLNVAIRDNVRDQAEILSTASPVLKKLIAEGKLRIVGGVYDLATGRVTRVPDAA
ncbi:MAG: carbonic anhydrase [Gemmatimonadales bacterium]|nr:carbonic anhydrase [Gemmatimonadales bacterium]